VSTEIPTHRRLPHSIGRYRILARLGKGAMGVVYSAQDSVMERTVAIKVMMTDFEDDPETSARFYREARAAGQLVHPNIITIFDMGEEDGRPFIVMELLEGDTLQKFMERPEGTDLETKIDLMIQISEGLEAAHSRGIFHRDIKPGNLLVRPSGELKIVDFGIARLAASNMTASGLIVGTPDYMSPEQARGQEVDGRSDVFSAGAVFYFMLTGRKPFAAADLTAVLMKVQTQEPLPIRETEAPPQLIALVKKALAKSPDDRFQSCAQMSMMLARVRRDLRAEVERSLDRTTQLLDAVDAIAGEHRALIAGLEITPAPTEFEAARVGLRARLASLTEDARSDAVNSLLAEARALHSAASADVERWRTASTALDQGNRAASAGALRQALDHYELVLKAEAGSRRAAAELDRCRRLLAERRVLDERVTALLAEARQAMAAKQWQAATAVCSEVLRLDSGCAEALALQLKAAGAIQEELHERRRETHRALARADSSLRKGHLDEARRELAHARACDPHAPELQASEERLLEAIAQAERDSALAAAAAAIIETARRMFAEGERTRAIDELRAFQAASPVASVATEIGHLEREARQLAAAEARAAEAAAHTENAQAALAGGDPDLALELASQALGVEPGHVPAREVASLARAEIEQRKKARARAAAAASQLEKAREKIQKGQFQKARALVAAAAELDPDGEHALVRDLIQHEETRVAAEEERLRNAKQRVKAAEPVLRRAAAALARGDYENAAWSAENALALDPECEEAKQILKQAREQLAAQPERDDTVDLIGNPSADPDDTVSLLPPESFWQRARAMVRGWFGPIKPLGADQSERR
jgi:hypothetical protein